MNHLSAVYRSQLPRKNDFYPYDPPADEEPATNADDEHILGSGVKLCRLCGCAGHKACSRCHSVTYCSKEHQTIDWKQRHKKECSSEREHWKMIISQEFRSCIHCIETAIILNLVFFFFITFWPIASSAVNMFLFPEWELVTEPEEFSVMEDKPPDSNSLVQANSVSSGNYLFTNKIWISEIFGCSADLFHRFGGEWVRVHGSPWITGQQNVSEI